MLDFLLIVALFAMILITAFGAFTFSSKFSKFICAIVFLTFAASGVIGVPIYKKATREITISNIEISEIYRDGENEYFVKTNSSDEFIKVTVDEIYKGDSNYLIKRHSPYMTKGQEFLLEHKKNKYDLVVTDLNIPKLSSID